MTVTSLREITIGTADLERRIAVYRDTFGMRVLQRGPISAASAEALWGLPAAIEAAVLGRPDAADGTRIRLLAVDPAVAEARPDRGVLDLGPLGVGFTTRGVQTVWDRVRASGVAFISRPVKLTPGATADDPFRYECFGATEDSDQIVLIERGNTPVPYGVISDDLAISQPLHTSHIVADLNACRRFMVEALGHQVLVREHCVGPLFEELMGLPTGQMFDFEMLWQPAHQAGRIIFIQHETPRSRDQPVVAPPRRGLSALRYDTDELDAVAGRIESAGGIIVRGPIRCEAGPIGRGRVLMVRPPFGILIEIWEPDEIR